MAPDDHAARSTLMRAGHLLYEKDDTLKPIATATLAVCLAMPAAAQETRELDAHVHGVSTLQIAIEASALSLDLMAPGMDITGFEHAATAEADKDAIAVAIARLLQPDLIVTLPEAAGCRLNAASAHLHGADDHDDDHGADHEDHAGDDHGDDHGDDGDHAGHDEEHQAEEDGNHSAFHATYAFDCDDTAALTTLAFPFFDQFPNAMRIEAEYVSDAGAGRADVPRETATLTLE